MSVGVGVVDGYFLVDTGGGGDDVIIYDNKGEDDGRGCGR